MQIFKCIVPKLKSGQNLVEFAFVLPILIFMTLAIFEVALFWQDLNSVYSLNAEINANAALLQTDQMDLGKRCTAAEDAIKLLKTKAQMVTLYNKPTYNDADGINDPDLVVDGEEPFALYKYKSQNLVAGNPQVTMWVDCRNPFENGVMTQIEFFHKTIIMKAQIPRPDKSEPIVIIPDNIFIASPKLNTIRHY